MHQVVGIGERRTGTASRTGKPYDFTAIYCTHPAENVKGVVAEEIMFSHTSGLTLPDIAIGDMINVSYDKRGFLQGLTIAEKSSGKGGGLPNLPPGK